MHFYTSTNNSHGKPVNAGSHKKRGQITWARSYSTGVKVVSESLPGDKGDCFSIYMTGGSDSPLEPIFVGQVTQSRFGKPMFRGAK